MSSTSKSHTRESVKHRHHPTRTPGIYTSSNGKPRGLRWEVKYTDPATGKQRWSPAFKRRQGALSFQAEVRGKVDRGVVLGDPTATFNDLLPGWREWREAIGTKPRSREGEERNLRLYIVPRWGRTRVRDIHPTDIVTWVAGLKRQDGQPMNDGTKATVLAHMSSVLNYAIKGGVVATNAVKRIDRHEKPKQGEKVKRVLQEGELEQLLDGLGRQEWLGPILRLLACTGMRLGEVVGLQWQDIDFQAETITVRRQAGASKGTTKSGKERVLDMLGAARSILLEQRKVVAAQRLALGLGGITGDTPVFTNTHGGQRQSRDVQRAFDWARDRAGISAEPRPLTMHDFRATVGTRLMLAGIPSPDVCSFMGHASIATTERYYLDKSKKSETWQERASAAMAS